MQRKLLTSAGLLALYLAHEKKTQCCGIIGILSDKRANISESLSMGVELLKNRGYDSAGIVTFSQADGVIEQKIIKRAQQAFQSSNCIDRLVKQVSQKITKAHIGIGHTRWATCGAKVQRNAHPHYDSSKSIFIVHNGIISGYATIKKNYLSQVKFNSQTDSQVVAQLLAKFTTEGSSMIQAIKKTQKVMKQTSENPQWGIVIINKNFPHKMWTTTNGSPILIGMNDQQIFVASESIAFQKESDCYFVTKDGQIFELEIAKIPELRKKMQKQGRLRYFSKQQKAGVLVKPPQPYNSFYSYQIRQQGQLKFNPEFNRVKALDFGPYLTMIACGSSNYAALTAQYYFKKLKTFSKVSIYDPAELLQGDISPKQTVVLISQSGQTKDLINVVQKCHDIQGVKTVGVINVQGSTLARKVDFPIYIKVGRQVSVAATKSMYHQVLNLIMLALEVATKKESVNAEIIQQMKKQLLEIPTKTKQTIEKTTKNCQKVAELLWKKQSVYLLAMRQSMAIAKQAALKIKQLNYIHAEALGACQMKHGPIALIQSQKPNETAVILFILDNQTFQQCANAFDQMTSRRALVIIVTDCKQRIKNHYQLKKKKQHEKITQDSPQKGSKEGQTEEENLDKKFIFLTVPKLKYFSSLLCLLPMQIMVQKICQLKKINPDMPRNLAKTVTV